MPSTRQLVRWAQTNASGWNQEGSQGIVPLLNEAQNILMQNETEQQLSFDTATGNFPSFNTREEVYTYDMPSNIWRVSMVLIDNENTPNLNLYLNTEYNLIYSRRPLTERKFYMGREYIRIPYIKTLDRTYENPCRVRFSFNPTALENTYLYRGYELPTQITSVRVEPSIPDVNGLHIKALMPALLKIIEAFQTNNWVEPIAYIEAELKPMVREAMNSGEQGMEGSIERIGF